MNTTICSTATLNIIALSKLKGMGRAAISKIIKHIDISSLSLEEIVFSSAKFSKPDFEKEDLSIAVMYAEGEYEIAEKSGVRILSVLDSDYPNLLRDTYDCPLVIYIKGRLHVDQNKSIAIIGTREPTKHGVIVTEKITSYFVSEGWSIVSGLALGLDAVAHETTLLNNGHTVAVLAHGLDKIYPKKNEDIAKKILEKGGALLSEYPFKTPAIGRNFVKRDKTQAGLAKGVVMVQSDIRGGSMHASRASIEYGRYLCVPCASKRDILMEEPKIGANLMLVSNSQLERAGLLHCSIPALDKVLVINSKDDYKVISEKMTNQIVTIENAYQVDLF